jgi:hypothetical protein
MYGDTQRKALRLLYTVRDAEHRFLGQRPLGPIVCRPVLGVQQVLQKEFADHQSQGGQAVDALHTGRVLQVVVALLHQGGHEHTWRSSVHALAQACGDEVPW